MAGKDSEIYRSKALERLSSPEALDQLMVVVRPRDWLPLLTIAGIIGVIVLWSFQGSIPTSINARSVLVFPRRIVDCQSTGAGLLKDIAIKAGDRVTAGQVIGTIDQSQTSKQLVQDRGLLAELQSQDTLDKNLQERQLRTELDHMEAQRESIRAEQLTLEKTLQNERISTEFLNDRVRRLRQLQSEGLLAEASIELFNAQQSVRENTNRIADAQLKQQQTNSQLKELEAREATLRREGAASTNVRGNTIRELQSRISLNESQLAQSSEMRCSQTGRVVEVASHAGEIVAPGNRVATIETDGNSEKLVSVSYFPIAAGKKIRPGMPVEVIPDIAERQRYGGIVGTVQSVSELPVTREAAKLMVGSSELLATVLPEGAYLEVIVVMEPDASTASGFKWSSSSGPASPITAGMTCTTMITTESRTPITYLFPFLRSGNRE